ncbi:hypothetical protein DFH94DRAFT_714429 [Russula ochroleuca]|uniref:Uncharacterized protein n=1 Tax=Russula ochroleuca TaxID=152965 RepID=A0A9P5N1W5_9AGAM|nr:hypothetical protein DFH94DRAFT_714429 [Russula ochroleuca]
MTVAMSQHDLEESCVPSPPPTPEGWTSHIHPRGWFYFYHSKIRVVTNDDIRTPSVLDTVEKYIATYPLGDLADGMELLIPHGPQPDEHMFSLIVNHKSCMAGYDLKDVMSTERMEADRVNKRRRMYWNYLERHPNHVPLPPNAEQEARDALAWFHLDNLKSGTRSTVPFSKQECEDLLDAISRINSNLSESSPGRTVFISWILRIIWSFRVTERYGQDTYRQWEEHYAQRIPTGPLPNPPFPVYIRIPLNFIISAVFFSVPRSYLEHIKAASQYHGRLSTVQDIWDQYTHRIVKEYQDFLLIATVLLSATVGLLSVPNIQSTSRAAGIVSVFASMGSMITGVFCLWRHQTNVKQSQSFTYLHNAHHGAFGLHGHALFLSLPPVLLVWGIIAFAVGFIAYTAQGLVGDSGTGEWDAALIALSISLLILLVVALGLYTFAGMWKTKRAQFQKVVQADRP